VISADGSRLTIPPTSEVRETMARWPSRPIRRAT
jgi:hypothetical protein